jgi:hypothetical protein
MFRACSAALLTDPLTENEAPSVNAARSDGMKDRGDLLSAFTLVVLLADYSSLQVLRESELV